MKSLITISAALLLALCLSASYHLDDHSGESAAADAAIAEQQQEIKMLRAAVDMCGGENAVVQNLGNGTVQCLTNRGHKTIVAKVTQ